MRSYGSSRFRLVLLAVLLALTALVVRPMYAQTTQPGEATAGPAHAQAAVPQTRNPFALVLENLDFVFVTIAALSVTGLTLIIHGLIRNRREVYMPAATVERLRAMAEAQDVDALAGFTASDPSFVSRALHPALRRYPDFDRMREAMETSVGEQTAESFRRIEYLNIIGNLGPLLGLLGTVLGMIEAFQAMNAAGGQANPAQLAGGISKALAHTMLGLLLAVPCLAAFGVLRTMVDRLTTQSAIAAEELLLALRPGNQHAPGQRAITPPPAIRQAFSTQPR